MSLLRRIRRKKQPREKLRHNIKVKPTDKIIARGTICEACQLNYAVIELMPHINGKQVGRPRTLCPGCAHQTVGVVEAQKLTARKVAQQKQDLGFCVGGPGCGKLQGSVKATHLFTDPDGKGPPIPMCQACSEFAQKMLKRLEEKMNDAMG